MGAATVEAPDRPEGAADDISEEAAEALAADEQKKADKAEAKRLAKIAKDAHEEAVGVQLTLDAGGNPASTSEFKIAGRAIEISGEFAKGSTTVLKVGIEWGAVEFIDKHDKETGQVVETIRRHKGRIVSYDVES